MCVRGKEQDYSWETSLIWYSYVCHSGLAARLATPIAGAGPSLLRETLVCFFLRVLFTSLSYNNLLYPSAREGFCSMLM